MNMKFKATLLGLSIAAVLPTMNMAQTPVYLDTSKPIEERVKDALSRMTLEEKIAMTHAQSKFSSPGVPPLRDSRSMGNRWPSRHPSRSIMG